MNAAAPASTSHRFEALDALRGVCAVIVVQFHMPIATHWRDWPLVQNGYLFVDFFFVLSGFVIAHAYAGRLGSVGDAGVFMARRLGRVWPLHMAILIAFVLLEVVRWRWGFDAIPPFQRDRAPDTLWTNVLLIQAFNVHPYLTWNGPAWSISVEVGAYVVFAVLVLATPRQFAWVAATVAVAGAVIVLLLAPKYMNTTYNYGFPRAVYGFFLGCLMLGLWRRWAAPVRIAWGLELAAPLLVILYLNATDGPGTVLAPLIFAAAIWVFAGQGGPVSRVLTLRPFVSLGRWSYSIYMVHMLVITMLLIVARKVEIMPNGRRIDLGSAWLNDALALGVLAAIVAISALTYRLIEGPGRDLVNGWLARRPATRQAVG